MSFFFHLSNFFIKYYLCQENVNKHAKNINNTQNDKPQSQIKAKLFNIQLLLGYSVFTIQFLMNQNFQFQKKKKKKTVTCSSVLSQLSTCSLVGPLSHKPKESSERFGVGVYFLSFKQFEKSFLDLDFSQFYLPTHKMYWTKVCLYGCHKRPTYSTPQKVWFIEPVQKKMRTRSKKVCVYRIQ